VPGPDRRRRDRNTSRGGRTLVSATNRPSGSGVTGYGGQFANAVLTKARGMLKEQGRRRWRRLGAGDEPCKSSGIGFGSVRLRSFAGPGTLRRDLSGNDENGRDLNRTSDCIRSALALVSETLAQDPANRPTHVPQMLDDQDAEAMAG
jgi:hypothetical protein